MNDPGATAIGPARRAGLAITRNWRLPVASLWIARYAAGFHLRLFSPPRWAGWFDQDRYVRSAAAFAHGDLTAAAHWYPLAYPLLAVPFVSIVPGDPFFVPNLVLYLIACSGFGRAMAPFGISRTVATAIFVLSALIVDSTAALWLIPWNTTLSAALTWWLIAAGGSAIRDAAEPPPPLRSMSALGLIAGALPLVRPTEALTSASALFVVLPILTHQRRLTARGIACLGVGGAAILVPYALLYLAIYGARPSTYMVEAAKQGFAFGDLPWKSYVLIVTAQPWYPQADTLIERLPWLLPGTAGLAVTLVAARGHARHVLLLIGAVMLPYAALFLAYTDLQPPGLWKFNNAHYFTWLFPLFGAGAWLWLRALATPSRRTAAVAALIVAAAPACLRILPDPIGDDRPARLLMFRGSTARDRSEAYFAPARIADSAGTLANVGQFHQLPDPNGERAIAITRPFARHPRRSDPGEPARFGIREAPYARYGERLSIGPPCWIARADCALPPMPGTMAPSKP